MEKKKINVMIVDDSVLFRQRLTSFLRENDIQVTTTASNGQVALQKLQLQKYRPDVILMDIVMPVMDGVTTIKHIMDRFPLPVIIVTAREQYQIESLLSNKGLSIIESGLVEFVQKPEFNDSINVQRFENELLRKIRVISRINLVKAVSGFDFKKYLGDDREGVSLPPLTKITERVVRKDHNESLIIIGASTGGPRAISVILSKLPGKIPPIVVIQHMPEMMMEPWVNRLQKLHTHLKIVLIEDNMFVRPNTIYFAAGDFHCIIENKRFRLIKGEKVNFVMPSIDVTLKSAAKFYQENLLVVILTGMGKDGYDGAIEVKQHGGKIITEDESTAIIYSMPKVIKEAGLADIVSPLHDIPKEIRRMGWI